MLCGVKKTSAPDGGKGGAIGLTTGAPAFSPSHAVESYVLLNESTACGPIGLVATPAEFVKFAISKSCGM